jgi:hypothetical protein
MKISPWLTLGCLVFLPIAATAQEQATADERQACEPDVNRLCGQFIPDRDKIILCLNQKVKELSPSCRGAILFYAQQQIRAGDSSRLCGDAGQDREKVPACLNKKNAMLSASLVDTLSASTSENANKV